MERKNSQARLDANRRFNDKTYERVSFSARKDQRINDLVTIAAQRSGMSKAEYMLTAIRAKLIADGIDESALD